MADLLAYSLVPEIPNEAGFDYYQVVESLITYVNFIIALARNRNRSRRFAFVLY